MISISDKKWVHRKVNKNLSEKIKQDYKFSDILSELIISRNFNQVELSSIDNDLDLNNVFAKNIDYQKSLDLISKSIKNKDNICILGDYDVDGSAATSLFIRFFESIKHPFFFYIPDREKDGYGASKKLFKKLILKKPKLVIMLDCGSTSNEAIKFLNENKIKSLIIDHHEINKPFPLANSIINPKKDNGYIQYDYLCATSLTYFFLDQLSQKFKSNFKLSNFLIYVLLATVCDVMPLRKINRLIAIKALNEFDINKNIALNTLFSLNNKKNKLNVDDLGFLIGPILNAGGRLGKPTFATELLASNNSDFINLKANMLIKLNDKRKQIEKITFDEIDLKKILDKNENIIIYYNSKINEGLIGIIAARLKEYFNKPSIVITNSGNILKGSARSTDYYNIGRSVKNLLDQNIISGGGGHNMAAGFTLEKKNLDIFKDYILKDFANKVPFSNYAFLYDAEVSSSVINKDFYYDIKRLEPFGSCNPNPIFLFKDLKVIKVNVLNGDHLSVILKSKSGFSIKSISFNSINKKVGNYLQNYKKKINVLAEINENNWNNKKTLQLNIHDLVI